MLKGQAANGAQIQLQVMSGQSADYEMMNKATQTA